MFSFGMAQVPKEHVRQAFVDAAARVFADLGYEATSMALIAERAGSSVGNLYKYFPGKRPLFDAAIPPDVVKELSRLTRARMRAFGSAKDVRELAPDARYHALAGGLLDYCFAHRSAVIVVLARAEGTPYADFRQQFVTKLCEWALEYARRIHPGLPVSAELRFALEHAYASFIANIAEALRSFPNEERTRSMIALLTSYHQGGLARLFETYAGEAHDQSTNAQPSPLVRKAPGARARNTGLAAANSSPTRPGAGPTHRRDRARRRC